MQDLVAFVILSILTTWAFSIIRASFREWKLKRAVERLINPLFDYQEAEDVKQPSSARSS